MTVVWEHWLQNPCEDCEGELSPWGCAVLPVMMGNAHRDALFGFAPVDQAGGLEAFSQGVSRDTGDLAKM